jgi:hypothetical protein
MSKDQSAQFFHRIGEVTDLLMEEISLGLGRLLQALAGDIEEPAVIRATDAALLDVAVFEGRAAVRAVETHEADSIVEVAEENQLFAQEFHSYRNVT